MKLLKITGLLLLVVLVGLQFFPAGTNHSTTIPATDFVKTFETPEQVAQILRTSCYNCHSNNTNYPWYSRVQPVGWFLENHINKGKEELNFSEFGSYSDRKQKSKLTSMISQVEDGEMPLTSYTSIHREARLSAESKGTLIEYLEKLKESL
ncbi:MAG: heme-binding domain-containing protein [Bacteroidales bacterium]|nr:heme-binding domain-containing protein [Mariniphaga sp.]NLB92665.1 heme-binding domain-containing protein [Bacteroidales bacterium]